MDENGFSAYKKLITTLFHSYLENAFSKFFWGGGGRGRD